MDLTAHLDIERGAWLTSDETAAHDQFVRVISDNVTSHDVVALFGAAGGGIAACLRRCHPAHLILVENDHDNRRLLEMSWGGARGVTIIHSDPVAAMPHIIEQRQPSIAVLNFPDRLTEVGVITVLAQPNESLDILVVVNPVTPNEQHEGVDELIRTWQDTELRWHGLKHDGPSNVRLYLRGGQP